VIFFDPKELLNMVGKCYLLRFSPKLMQEIMVRNVIQFQKSMTMRNSLEDSNVIIHKSSNLIRNEVDDASVCYGDFAYVSCSMLLLISVNKLRSHHVESHVIFLFVCHLNPNEVSDSCK